MSSWVLTALSTRFSGSRSVPMCRGVLPLHGAIIMRVLHTSHQERKRLAYASGHEETHASRREASTRNGEQSSGIRVAA